MEPTEIVQKVMDLITELSIDLPREKYVEVLHSVKEDMEMLIEASEGDEDLEPEFEM